MPGRPSACGNPRGPGREALRQLPGAYSLALRLRDVGVPDELIAECLALEHEALGPLLELAESKLAAVLRAQRGE